MEFSFEHRTSESGNLVDRESILQSQSSKRTFKLSQRQCLLLIGILVGTIWLGDCHTNFETKIIRTAYSSDEAANLDTSSHKKEEELKINSTPSNSSTNINKLHTNFADTRRSSESLDLSKNDGKIIYDDSGKIGKNNEDSEWNRGFEPKGIFRMGDNTNFTPSNAIFPPIKLHNIENEEGPAAINIQSATSKYSSQEDHMSLARSFGQIAPDSPSNPSKISIVMKEVPEIALPPGFTDTKTSEGCQCWQTVDDKFSVEKECICRGEQVTAVPTNLANDVQRLTFSNVPIISIKGSNLKNYESTLQEITFANSPNLSEIEKETFANLGQLKSLAFHHAPKLDFLPDDIFDISLPNLKIMRFSNTGLRKLPRLNQLTTNNILHLVDFEYNEIRSLKSLQISIRVEQMLLNNNEIEFIDRMAFKGSEIGTLRLRGNRKLKLIHPEAFGQIKSLRVLDLSETAIEELPVDGLDELEELYLQGVKSLKVFPSVFAFRKLSKASLTYHYHCCAFYFPQVHNPEAYRKQEERIKFFQKKHCSKNVSLEVTSVVAKEDAEAHEVTGPLGPPDYFEFRADEFSPSISYRSFEEAHPNAPSRISEDTRGRPPRRDSFAKGHSTKALKNMAAKNADEGILLRVERRGTFNYRIPEGVRDNSLYANNNSGLHFPSSSDEETRQEFPDDYEEYPSSSLEGFFYSAPEKDFLSTTIDVEGSGGAKDPSAKDEVETDAAGDEQKEKDNGENEIGRDRESAHKFGRFHQETARVSENHLTAFCGKVSLNLKRKVICEPQPDAFNPCEDILGGFQGVRAAVWVVVGTAVVGNFSVMIVLLSARFKMTVSKLLMCNLAFADLCMGFYLMIIAAMDIHTQGKYFNFAIDWQNGIGCKLGGFLTVFSSELSVMTLTVITLERWYAITYAIHLTKRLRLGAAKKIMICAWFFSSLMATLPLVGVSSYSKTSICLPMENKNFIDLLYLLILLSTNGLAFFLICICYLSMYFSISKNNMATSSSDMTVAKRMGLLVATDFACWAPIAFFGLTAVAGYPLIGVTHAKFLLVFFYPLNSCANPYLYAILTKQYRKDFFILLARYGFCAKRAAKYKGACSSLTNPHIQSAFAGPNVHKEVGRRISTLTQISTLGEYCTRRKERSLENIDSKTLLTIQLKSVSSSQLRVSPSEERMKQLCAKNLGAPKKVLLLEPQKSLTEDRAGEESQIKNSSSSDSFFNIKSYCSSGSPHPIKNWQTKIKSNPENELILKQFSMRRSPSGKVTNQKLSLSEEDIPSYPGASQPSHSPSTITSPLSLYDEEVL